jgi:hypothetical protein
VPARCSRPTRAPAGGAAAPARLDGTYRWRLTADGARRLGLSPQDPTIGTIVTMTLRGGRWLLETDVHDVGSFTVRGHTLVFDWPVAGYLLRFRFARHADGTLDVDPLPATDIGDQFVWASEPWKRIGPPVREIPAG